jgi:hypothetical protein
MKAKLSHTKIDLALPDRSDPRVGDALPWMGRVAAAIPDLIGGSGRRGGVKPMLLTAAREKRLLSHPTPLALAERPSPSRGGWVSAICETGS